MNKLYSNRGVNIDGRNFVREALWEIFQLWCLYHFLALIYNLIYVIFAGSIHYSISFVKFIFRGKTIKRLEIEKEEREWEENNQIKFEQYKEYCKKPLPPKEKQSFSWNNIMNNINLDPHCPKF